MQNDVCLNVSVNVRVKPFLICLEKKRKSIGVITARLHYLLHCQAEKRTARVKRSTLLQLRVV